MEMEIQKLLLNVPVKKKAELVSYFISKASSVGRPYFTKS
jgi:hypothetical protein